MAKLSVLIGADDRELQAALKRARSSLRKLGKEMREGVNDAARWSAGVAAAGVAVGTYFVKQTLDAVGAQADLAAQLNTTTASIAVLEGAATLSGVAMTKVESGGKRLTVALGQAAQGTGPAVDALGRLNLSANELARMPLDQRIAQVNDAIREQIPVAQQAAVAAKFYGDEAGAAILQLSGDAIKEAAEDARVFGTALSDVDSKKVEMAGDSMDRVGLAINGFLTQMTVQAAPVIKAVADEIAKMAKEAGGFGNIAASAFDKVVTGAGFVMDAIDGVGRVFSVVADGIITGLSATIAGFVQMYSALLKILDAIPGLDFSASIASLDQFAAESIGVANEAMANIEATLNKPMASEGLNRFVDQAKAAGQAAAEAAAAAQPTTANGGEEESSEDGLTDKERESMQKRLDAMRAQFMTEEELSQQRRDAELEQIAEFEDAKLIAEGEGQMMREEAEFAHWQRIREMQQKEAQAQIDLEKKKNDALKRETSNFMSNLSGLMNTENRKLFELGKAAAIGQAAYKGGLAVMDAWEAGMSVGGPWAPAVAAAYAGAAALNAANLINNIRNQQFGGGGGTPTAPTQGSSNISTDNGAGGGSTSSGSSGPTSIITLNGDTFSRDSVRALLEQLNEEGADGGRYVIA